MMSHIFSSISTTWHVVWSALFMSALSVAVFFGYHEAEAPLPLPLAAPTASLATASADTAASSSIVIAVATSSASSIVIPTPVKTMPKPKPFQPITLPPVVSTSTEPQAVGSTMLAVQTIPLLGGGEIHAGSTVPIAYLQMTNVGPNGTYLKGFRIIQNGSAPEDTVIAFSTVDDKGASRGSVGGVGATLFTDGVALVPTEAYFAPGQMRLFTVKATMTGTLLPSYAGLEWKLDVSGLVTEALVRDHLPLQGTTWVLLP